MGAPTLRSLSFVSQHLALRNMLKMEASDLHSMQREDWIESGIPPGELDELLAWLKLNPDRRRRLATEATGYGPHDHASTRCHIHRLLASEALCSQRPSTVSWLLKLLLLAPPAELLWRYILSY